MKPIQHSDTFVNKKLKLLSYKKKVVGSYHALVNSLKHFVICTKLIC
jgi:hypothetical protein